MTTYTAGRGPHRSEPTASAPLAAPALRAMAAPTGPHPVGTISLHLADCHRPAPRGAAKPSRELRVDVRYPAREVERYERAPGASAHQDAPPALDPSGPRPVVLCSPGAGEARSERTRLADELASHGYVVVVLDHGDDARSAGFPQGRAAEGPAVDGRVADVRFALDQLVSLAPGVLDLSRIGLFGGSAGCAAELTALHEDPRITAIADLDGHIADPDGNPAAARTEDPGAPLVTFFDRRLRGRGEPALVATAARAGR
ncbi:alpha/beta hydrolase [Streptomyces sparsogenes]|uniref:serine aminopeptidase domain-containing protein n=1 Tax=Streptomyces sparsogenes TaxID=67365 RepID=UPI003332783F